MRFPAVALIVGRPNSGKTAYLEAVIRRQRAQGLNIGGLLSHGIWEDGRKSGFILETVTTGERRQLADSLPRWDPVLMLGRFYFSPEAFSWGNAVLQAGAGAGLVVVDECGPLEMSGGGLWPGIDFLLRNHSGPLLIAVRPALLAEVQQRIQSIAEEAP